MDIRDIPTDELDKELLRREKAINRPSKVDAPAHIDFKKLIDLCEEVLDDIEKDGYSKDHDHYIYEEAMQCIYGPKVWDWLNKHTEDC
jgi:hypothetical protein